jgi:hypothetical protein
VVLADVYCAGEWKDFFVLVGSGSATLAGLVFVALTLNLSGVARDATHKYRAINMLAGFTSVFIISALALMGHQTHRTFGVEWLVVAAVATAINTNGYVQAFRVRSSLYALSWFRIVGGSTCYAAQLAGASLLYLDVRAGIYVAALGLVANFGFFVSGAWLLILGPLQSTE